MKSGTFSDLLQDFFKQAHISYEAQTARDLLVAIGTVGSFVTIGTFVAIGTYELMLPLELSCH